jgi:transcription elongation factor GreA
MNDELLVTEEGLQQLQADLHELTVVKREEIAERIKEARELGDLKENAEYHDAKNEQAFIETKIRDIETKIRNAKIVEKADSSKVSIGTVVTVAFDGDDLTEIYTITSSVEADPLANKISNESPIGQALMGSKEGATVTANLPKGPVKLTVKRIALV